MKTEQVRLVSVEAERPNHPSRRMILLNLLRLLFLHEASQKRKLTLLVWSKFTEVNLMNENKFQLNSLISNRRVSLSSWFVFLVLQLFSVHPSNLHCRYKSVSCMKNIGTKLNKTHDASALFAVSRYTSHSLACSYTPTMNVSQSSQWTKKQDATHIGKQFRCKPRAVMPKQCTPPVDFGTLRGLWESL